MDKKASTMPAQHQKKQPGSEYKMHPHPIYLSEHYKGSDKLKGKIALITGGDSGIGRAVSCAFAKEGANLIIQYLNEERDAKETQQIVEGLGAECWLISANLQNPRSCENLLKEALAKADHLDILINNIAEQHPQDNIDDISDKQMEATFKTNFFSCFYMCKAALAFLEKGAVIINTASVTAYKGSAHLIDYSATKGAIVSFTRSLSQNLVSRGIRVNAVAPGPIWTPLIPASFSAEEVKEFGKNVPMKRPGQPCEIAPSYVFLACEDSSYMTGQVLHPNGGVIVNS